MDTATTAHVDRLEALSASVRRVVLRLPDARAWTPRAGQYVEVLMEGGQRKAFSVANAPLDDGLLEIHVRLSPGSAFADHVFGTMRPGDRLALDGPRGHVAFDPAAPQPVLMVCGGTGFAQIKALVEHSLLHGSRRPLHVFRGAATAADLYLDTLPRRWVLAHPHVRYTTVVEAVHDATPERPAGRVHEVACRTYGHVATADIYLCGPGPMVTAARAELLALGAAPDRIHHD